jgi:hypothetical protein
VPDPVDHDRSDLEDAEDDEWDEEDNDLLYLKYLFEGATTLAELSAALRRLADDLDRQASQGWRLMAPVNGGWAHLVREEA